MKLAVVIASYNRCSTVLQALDSALGLLLPAGWQVKIIVVDDGSTDSTFEHLLDQSQLELREEKPSDERLLRKAQSQDGQVFVIRTENSERGAARNYGARLLIEKFSPEWLLFLDSDDVLVETALLRFSQALHANGSEKFDFLYSWCALWDGRNSPTRQKQLFLNLPSGDIGQKCLDDTFVPLGGTLIRSEVFVRVRMFPEDRRMGGSEDKILLTKMALIGRALFCPMVSVWYRQHPQNTSVEKMVQSIELMENKMQEELNVLRPHFSKSMQRIWQRQCFFKKIGYAVYKRSYGKFFLILGRQVISAPQFLFDWRFPRLLISLFISILK